MKTEQRVVLNVGCGPKGRMHGFTGLADWREVRMDIDPGVHPDVLGSMTDMTTVATGSIAAIDILYGLRSAMAAGNLYMAHRCGFTLDVLANTLRACGFARCVGQVRPEQFDLWMLASKGSLDDDALHQLARRHLPF